RRVPLSVNHAPVRLLSRERSAANLQTFIDRSAHVSAGGKGEDARGKESGATTPSSSAAKHVQDSDQQLLRLSRVRPGTFRRFRRRSAGHPNRARFIKEDDRVVEWARRESDRGRYGRDLFRAAGQDRHRSIAER